MPPEDIGDLLSDDTVVYRAFSKDGHRKSSSKKVRRGCFNRERKDDDGLSVGTTPAAAVQGLAQNFGYCSITVREIHALNRGLEVRADKTKPGHAFICNLPFMETDNDEERASATELGGMLAHKAIAVTCEPYTP
jgi:hypothetical protein